MGSCFDAGGAAWNLYTLPFTAARGAVFTQPLDSVSAAPVQRECWQYHLPAGDTWTLYPHDTSTSSLIEPPQPSSLLSLFPPAPLNTPVPYPQDGGAFYQHSAQLYPGLDVRSRLGSNTSTSSIGMAHTHPHRTAPLPHPGHQISARDQYTPATPGFRRDHPSRSPSFPGNTLRRHPLSPTASPIASFTNPTARMGSNQYATRPAPPTNIPPLRDLIMMGSLVYADGSGTPAKVEITGTIDKGFFLSDQEWTCYRRNYFSCVCSFALSPNYPGTAIHFTPSNSSSPLLVHSWAMCISAVVSDNETHNIELVQHTPKRDKGPIIKPEKVHLVAKQSQPAHHMGMYTDGVGPGRSMYADSFPSQPSGQQYPTEHTFERIQFKQATQNNGKRRAAQQYYQLVVELWADVGSQRSDQFIKVAYRKSAKMIVRGRSPGHYQNDRRGSQSSGPGGSAGAMGGYAPVSGMPNYDPNSMMGGQAYGGGYDGRGGVYGVRHHDIPQETMIPSEDAKAIDTTKDYQYYPGPIYEGQSDRTMELFHRTESENSVSHITTGLDINGRVKNEYDGTTLPSIFQNGPLVGDRHPRPFEGKSSSSGYYPTMMPSSGPNITMA
ncbi:Fc.00g090350.m01.CDS01 [Cosmosporella sp. VM-42]